MPAPNTVSFMAPTGPAALAYDPSDYATQLRLQQQQALAGALMQGGMQPIEPNRTAGRFVVPISPLEGLSKVGQTLAGALIANKSIDKQADLAAKQNARMGGAFGLTTPQPQATTGLTTPAFDPVSGMSHPSSVVQTNPEANAPFGVPMQPPAAAPAGAQRAPLQMPGMTPQESYMAYVANPNAYMTALFQRGNPTDFEKMMQAAGIDPSSERGKQMIGQWLEKESNPPVSGRAGAPIWQRGPDGQMRIVGFSPKLDEGMTMGPNGEVKVAPGYTGAKTDLAGLDTRMVDVPVSNQRTLKLTQQEALRFNQSGGKVLPSRYSALKGELPGVSFSDSATQAAPSAAPAAAAPSAGGPPAPRFPASQVAPAPQAGGRRPDVGVVGATQSQEEQINQQRQTAAGKAVDEQFAKDYVAFTTGGAQDAAKQLAQLKDVVTRLNAPGADLTGPIRGRVPDSIQAFTATGQKAIGTRERVEEVVQRSLRAILGAQFTEKEGERLIARAYNPTLGEKENAVRVQRLLTQLDQAFQAKQDAARYFEKNGTLEGWKGKLPSISDFNPEGTESAGKIGTTATPNKIKWSDLGR